MKKLFLIASAAVLASCASNVSVSSDYVEVPQFGKGIAEVKTQQGTVAG